MTEKKHSFILPQWVRGSLTRTLNWAWRRCWDLVDLSSRQSQLVALKLEGDGFTALAGRHRSSCQGGELGYAHYLTSLGRRTDRRRGLQTMLHSVYHKVKVVRKHMCICLFKKVWASLAAQLTTKINKSSDKILNQTDNDNSRWSFKGSTLSVLRDDQLNISVHLQGNLACISGLSRTLWGRTLLGFGLGWAGILAVQEAVGGRTVSTGFGALDLTAVWAVGCMAGRGAVVATEHTTEGKKEK